jgi:hypothetical protein
MKEPDLNTGFGLGLIDNPILAQRLLDRTTTILNTMLRRRPAGCSAT